MKAIELLNKKDWNDSEYCLMAVRENPLNLEFVENQTPEICLEAVKQYGLALKWVKEQTPEICLAAVKQDGYNNGYNLKWVKEQTPEICLVAVKETGFALKFVKEQTPLIIHYLKKYHILLYASFKTKNRIAISENEMKIFYNENPHLLLTL